MRRRAGSVVWLTGLPATGKTTIARILESELGDRGVVTLLLDSDDLRSVLTPQAAYTDDERDRFYGAVGHLAELGARGGALVLVAATAPKRVYRDRVRARVDEFVEVLLICDPTKLEQRDPKGLYARAKAGEISRLPGRGAPYEDPVSPELVFDTARTSARSVAAEILDHLERSSRLTADRRRAPE